MLKKTYHCGILYNEIRGLNIFLFGKSKVDFVQTLLLAHQAAFDSHRLTPGSIKTGDSPENRLKAAPAWATHEPTKLWMTLLLYIPL